jgi:hypothetical protein
MPDETPNIPYPAIMLVVAIFFDIVGMIPFINFFTEPLASLIVGFWYLTYESSSDILLNFLKNKLIDICTFGLWFSNTAIVRRAYKDKVAKMSSQPVARQHRLKFGHRVAV